MRGDDNCEWSGSVNHANAVASHDDLLLIYRRLIVIRSALILV